MDSESGLLGIRGFLIDAPEFGKLRSWRDGALVIDNGLIAEIGDYEMLRKKPRPQKVRWTHSNHAAVFPGLIDLHTHLPQYPAVAKGQSDLLPWLRQHVFPLEKEFRGAKARKEISLYFQELARHGTTTAVLYTTIYEESCDAAFQAAEKSGLRVVMGKMMMDTGSYGQLPAEKILSVSLQESERLCKKWHGAADGRIEYAFSPRFALSCSENMMRAAADAAKRHSAYIQTHLSENLEEIENVRTQFSWAADYTDIYDKCGLLGPRSILGHCIHLSDREKEALAASGASIAHCPTANFFLSSGIMRLDQLLDRGIRIGLGTDVGAGTELNLWQVMRSSIEAQKARSFFELGTRRIGPPEALYLGTQGAAEALGKGGTIGSFEIGKEADLTLVDFPKLLPYRKNAKVEADLSAEDVVALCVYRGGPDAVVESFVRGNSLYRSLEPALF